MTKENLIPKTETIQELKDEYKIPTYEEFMKTYNKSKETVDSYENEFDSYGDIRIKGTYYGPGFWDEFLRPVTSVALAISYVTPLAAVTVPVSVAAGVTGAAMATISDDKDVKNVGCQMLGVVGQATAHHLDGGVSENVHKAKLIANYIIR